VVTYIKTSAVYALVVLAALTGDPLIALSAGLLFGLLTWHFSERSYQKYLAKQTEVAAHGPQRS